MNFTEALGLLAKFQGPLKTVREYFSKLNPTISVQPSGDITKILVIIDREYLDVNKELDLILSNVNEIKLSNLHIELRLRDKMLLLSDGEVKEGECPK